MKSAEVIFSTVLTHRRRAPCTAERDFRLGAEIVRLLNAVHDQQGQYCREKQVPDNVRELLVSLIQIYSLVLLVRVLFSWFPNMDRSNPLVQFVYQITEPVLQPVRQLLPRLGMIDISPIVVFLGLHILVSLLR